MSTEKREYEKVYHHSVEKWLQNHLGEVPEKFRDLFLRFVRYCRRTGVREVTLYTYLPKIRDFLQYLHEQDIGDICEIDEDLIYDFIGHLEERGKIRSELTRRRNLEILKKFVRFLIEKKICTDLEEVYKRIRIPGDDYLPIYTPPSLVKAIEEFIMKIPDLKYRTLYALLYETGARIGEILRVKLNDIVEKEYGYDIIIRKSKSMPRKVHVVTYQNVLKAWLSVHPGWNSEDRSRYYLIYGSRPDEPLTRSAVNNYLSKLIRKPEFTDLREIFMKYLGKPYPNPHLLRHARAYFWAKKKISEKIMCIYFGWKTRKMVDKYTHITDEETREIYLREIVGIKVEKEQTGKQAEQVQEFVRCPRCGHVNIPGSRYCSYCGCPLTLESTLEKVQEEKEEKKELLKLLREIAKILKKGDVNLSELFRELSP